MKFDETENHQLDELIRQSYAPLVQDVAGQRQVVLDGIAAAGTSRDSRVVPRHNWPSRIAWVVAASILLAIGVKTLLIPSSDAQVYGLEAAGRRLCEVQTIQVHGVHYFYNDKKPEDPPVVVPFEQLIKRPGKFSHTWTSRFQDGDVMNIHFGRRVSDGRLQTIVRDTEKQYTTTRVNPIDAQLTTETFAQWILRFAVLGVTEARYKKLGRETIGGRDCQVFEARTTSDPQELVVVDKLWFDPVSGFPIRRTIDHVLDDGKTRRDCEYNEIAVNEPLADELFATTAPAGYERQGDAPDENTSRLPLNLTPTGCGSFIDQSISVWHSFRINDNTALVMWRRSAPKPGPDGTLDWLSQVQITAGDPETPARHAWIYQSGSPDVWNWSLVAAAGPELPDPGTFTLHMVTERFDGTMGACALRFPDDQLDEILQAAAAAALPAGAERPSLASLRATAAVLSAR